MKRRLDADVDHGSRRGGLRQRLHRQDLRCEVQNHQSALCNLLLELFAWGEMDAQLCQKIAHAAFRDACDMKELRTNLKDLERVATIGCTGVYPNKCFSELMSRIPFDVKLPLPFVEKIPFKKPLNLLPQAILLPHELFSSIWEWYPNTWKKHILPSTDRLREFWRTNQFHPSMASHSLKTRENFQSRAIPFSFHGDDVPITGVGKAWCALMTTFSMCSMVAKGETRDMQFMIYGVFERLRVKDPDPSKDTLGVFFSILSWSLRWLYLGQWPDRDWKGVKPLALLHLPFEPFSPNTIPRNQGVFSISDISSFDTLHLENTSFFSTYT